MIEKIPPLVILDFDGVIIESVDVKTRAFHKLFSFTPNHVNEIVNFHLQNGGMSRFDKFRYIYKNILKEPLSDEQYDFLCSRFSELVFNGVLNCPLVPGVETFLTDFSMKTSIFIVSATPEQELAEIVKQRNLQNYFKTIYGAPRTKYECIKEILANMKSSKDQAIFVGDALNDYKAAQETGVRFIGRIKPGDNNIFTNCSNIETIISDMNELKSHLESI